MRAVITHDRVVTRIKIKTVTLLAHSKHSLSKFLLFFCNTLAIDVPVMYHCSFDTFPIAGLFPRSSICLSE